eukprot:7894193-Karenia_brevis.AAC.1
MQTPLQGADENWETGIQEVPMDIQTGKMRGGGLGRTTTRRRNDNSETTHPLHFHIRIYIDIYGSDG